MRPLVLILEIFVLIAGAVRAQNSGDSETPQLPVGQVFKEFEFPAYQDGKLKYTLYATEARGITLNRAETSDLKIDVYDNGAVTTTITSPKADLYVNDQRMRTKNTVRIERDDMEATSQDCDFDVKTKKAVLRTNVRVVLKHFDLSSQANAPASAATTTKPVTTPPTPAPADAAPVVPADASSMQPAHNDDSLLTSPGTYADTNSVPLPPPSK